MELVVGYLYMLMQPSLYDIDLNPSEFLGHPDSIITSVKCVSEMVGTVILFCVYFLLFSRRL